ncbi:hypothetical protein GQ44DRAFT_430915 [Phaeosphaeriaceae sp. PMI808]|nr:hypothetical protein GQ44DRAFT_430915 [Phaeosphaeriaceae sp. PMI808]
MTLPHRYATSFLYYDTIICTTLAYRLVILGKHMVVIIFMARSFLLGFHTACRTCTLSTGFIAATETPSLSRLLRSCCCATQEDSPSARPPLLYAPRHHVPHTGRDLRTICQLPCIEPNSSSFILESVGRHLVPASLGRRFIKARQNVLVHSKQGWVERAVRSLPCWFICRTTSERITDRRQTSNHNMQQLSEGIEIQFWSMEAQLSTRIYNLSLHSDQVDRLSYNLQRSFVHGGASHADLGICNSHNDHFKQKNIHIIRSLRRSKPNHKHYQ